MESIPEPSLAATEIRDACEEDLPEILAIYNDAILSKTSVYQYEPHTLEMRRSWLLEKRAGGYAVIVAAENDRVVGFGNLGAWRSAAAYKYTVETSVYVAEEHRGRGIGKLILGALVDASSAMHAHAVIAVVDAENAVSIGLHEAFGFEQAAFFKQVGYKFGRWLDLVFLELLLSTPQHPEEG